MNTDTNLETQNNTPYLSDEDIDYDSEAMRDDDDDIIYHLDPKEFMLKHTILAGKVKQSFIYCRQCGHWKPLTLDNLETLTTGIGYMFKRKRYVEGFCLTQKCITKHNIKMNTN